MSGVISQKKLVVRGQNANNIQRRTNMANMQRAGSAGNVSKSSSDTKSGVDRKALQFENHYIRNLQQQVYFLELENAYMKQNSDTRQQFAHKTQHNQHRKHHANYHQPPMHSSPQLLVDSNSVVHKLHHQQREKEMTKSALEQRSKEAALAAQDRDFLAERLQNTELAYTRDKETLCQELVELRKKLDDSEPELARRESILAETELSLQDALNKLQSTEHLCETFKKQLDQRAREDLLRRSYDDEKQKDQDQLLDNLRSAESELAEQKALNRSLTEDLSQLKQSLREAELRERRESALVRKLSNENGTLIKENSELTAKVETLNALNNHNFHDNSNANDFVRTQLADSKKQLKSVRQELTKAQEMLSTEQSLVNKLTSQISQQDSAHHQLRETQLKLQSRLEALETQNRSLSGENHQLRQEKLVLDKKIAELTKMLTDRDLQLQTIDQHYQSLTQQYYQESALQEQRSREFEKLAGKVRELSKSVRYTPAILHTDMSNFSPSTSNADEQ